MQYRGLTLDPFQTRAIEALKHGKSVLVSAPTGTGKTVVADWLVEREIAAGKEVVYTAPIKALSNQKFRDYCRMLSEDQVGLVTGDLVIRREAPVRVMTTEILRNMLLVGEQVPNLGAVIVDEIHFLDDRERGTVWEEVLIYLPQEVQIVGLSATLDNLEEFAAWLAHVRNRPVEVIVENKRAVPLQTVVCSREEGLLDPHAMEKRHKQWEKNHAHELKKLERDGRGHRGGRDGGRRWDRRGPPPRLTRPTTHQDVFETLHAEGQLPYLYFVFSRKNAEQFAVALGRKVGGSLLDKKELRAMEAHLERFRAQPGAATALDHDTESLYRKGIAHHHAGLHVMLKALVEELYEDKLIKVLYCTSTFALGINMPARAAVFDALVRFDGREMIPLPVREFYQMAGRAGRRGLDDAGLVVVRSGMEEYAEHATNVRGYLQGRAEPVRSSFSLSFNSIVNLLDTRPLEQIREIVDKSFLSFHRNRLRNQFAADADALEASLAERGWTPGQSIPSALKHEAKELRRMRNRLERGGGTDRTWDEFTNKVSYLQHYNYLGPDRELFAPARILQHIQIQEVFVTELVMEGIFEGLDGPMVFGILASLCNELPKQADTHAGKEFRGLARDIDRIRMSPIVQDAERLSGVAVVYDPRMMPFGKWWAEGRSLGECLLNLHSATDVSGDLVGAFRRAKDLAGQLRNAWRDDEAARIMLTQLIKAVSRDEVEVVD